MRYHQTLGNGTTSESETRSHGGAISSLLCNSCFRYNFDFQNRFRECIHEYTFMLSSNLPECVSKKESFTLYRISKDVCRPVWWFVIVLYLDNSCVRFKFERPGFLNHIASKRSCSTRSTYRLALTATKHRVRASTGERCEAFSNNSNTVRTYRYASRYREPISQSALMC